MGPTPDTRWPWRRWLFRLIRIAVCSYVGLIVLLMALENWLLFHPYSPEREWIAPPNPRVEDVQLRSSDGTLIHAWWCPVKDWQPAQGAMIYCHGNAGNLSSRAGAIALWQREIGQSVLIFDYPGYGRSQGKPSEAGCYAAVDAVYDWLTQTRQVPGDRILLYGGSLGGAVAVDLAARRPHRALILVSTFLSVPDMAQTLYPYLPARWLVRNRFDSVGKIGRCTRPVFVAHGTADRLVPFLQGKKLYEAANEPKCFLAMEGADHDEVLTDELYSNLRAFLADKAKLPREGLTLAADSEKTRKEGGSTGK